MDLIIKRLKQPISLILMFICFSEAGFAQNLSDPQAICKDISASNRAMAKAAGYDVDKLCAGLDNSKAQTENLKQPVVAPKPRVTVSTLSNDTDDQADKAMIEQESEIITSDLKPFGYDLFANVPNSFAASTNVPVSPDYLLGPGDELAILFYGKLNQSITVTINRDGLVDMPELGPIVLAGLTFGEAKEMLQSQIAAQVIGTQVNISMGTLRSMQIFVLGEAFKPGAYTVSSLSTITHALMSAGGVSDIASLRNIQLKRAGKTIATLDLYELLLQGNIVNDVRLQSSDVIYVPTVGDLVSIDGQVLRPAIYELKSETTVQELVDLAGGLGPKAFGKSARIERISDDGFMTVVDIDLTGLAGQESSIVAGDHLRVDEITNFKKGIVSLAGHVNHPGDFAWRSGMRASDLIRSLDQFPPDVDLDYALVVRETSGGSDINVMGLNLRSLLDSPQGKDDISLESRDILLIFSAYANRDKTLEPILKRLTRQSKLGGSAKVVVASGQVRFPGRYPLIKGMNVADLVTAAGGFLEGAYQDSAEVTRSDLSNPNRAAVLSMPISLASKSSFELAPLDSVQFKTMPDYRARESITLAGEVVFPGEYSFYQGETLSSVLERAGGFTQQAHIEGAVFTRLQLKQREQRELDSLRDKLNDQLLIDQLQEVNAGNALDSSQQAVQKKAIAQLNSVEAVGRLVLPLREIMDGSADDVLLENGDALVVPNYRQEVSIIGEVQQPTSYFYDSSLSVADYLEQSGGLLESADRRKIYVVKASGKVVLPKRSLLRFSGKNTKIEAGDTIVVPLDTDDKKIEGIPLIAEVSKIVYELALGAAAINSLNSP